MSNLDARIVRNGLPVQSTTALRAICVLAAVPRARWLVCGRYVLLIDEQRHSGQ